MSTETRLVPYAASVVSAATRALILAPHPDDEIFGCGGCAALHVQAGATVQPLILTDGSGAGDPAVREAESIAAAAVISTNAPEFWRLPDRGLLADKALVARMVDAVRRHQAQVVYAPSPWEVHPDHRAAAHAFTRAALQLGKAITPVFYEVGAPHWPNRLVDVTAVWPLKQAAMACFPSQQLWNDYRRHVEALAAMRTYTLGPEVKQVEALWMPTFEDLRRLDEWHRTGQHPSQAWSTTGRSPWGRLRRLLGR